jgi:hypothetical protein
MPETTADTGALLASKAQMCNVPSSGGSSHWYKLQATLPGSSTSYVQLELWDNLGAFKGGPVTAGLFTIAGDDADRSKCGVCVRAIGDKGASDSKEYFATGGTVNVTAVGGDGTPFSATLSDLSLVEIDASSQKPVSGGCAATVAATKIDGTVVQMGGNGGGGGGGGGGGDNNCLTGVGD